MIALPAPGAMEACCSVTQKEEMRAAARRAPEIPRTRRRGEASRHTHPPPAPVACIQMFWSHAQNPSPVLCCFHPPYNSRVKKHHHHGRLLLPLAPPPSNENLVERSNSLFIYYSVTDDGQPSFRLVRDTKIDWPATTHFGTTHRRHRGGLGGGL